MDNVKGKWISGSKLTDYLPTFEIVEAIAEGKLTPYNQYNGEKYFPEIDETEIINKRLQIESSIKKICCDYSSIDLNNILSKECIIEVIRRDAIEDEIIDSFHNKIAQFIFQVSEVKQYLWEIELTDRQPDSEKETTSPLQIESLSENYFIQNGKHWKIKFGKESAAHVDHIDGLLYIAHLLENGGKDISDQVLYQLAKGVPSKETISTSEMIERNLSKGFKTQPIDTDKLRKICQEKYSEFQDKLETASLEEQDEIKEQMDKLVPYLNMKKRNFVDPNDKKAQSNMKKRIDHAYDKLKEENMPELAKHLEDTIKTEYYGRRYIGTFTWKIKINK